MNRILFMLFIISSIAAKAQNNYREISLPELMKKKQQGDPRMVIIDVRSPGEYGDSSKGKSGNIGRIKDAVNIPLQDLMSDSSKITQFEKYKDRDIYLICSHSYRSRTVTGMLLRHGFTNITNTRGGMTEWYRRYDELRDYRNLLIDSDIPYKNLSPAELMNDLQKNKEDILIGINNKPRFWWDSGTVRLYKYAPLIRNSLYFDYADSLKILDEVSKNKGKRIVLFNMVNNGAAELAEWLVRKGYADVYYLVGGPYLLYEYAANMHMPSKTDKYFIFQNQIKFLTPDGYCGLLPANAMKVIDTRHDSLYNMVNEGVKHNYRHFKNSMSFYAARGGDAFEKAFPDKTKNYLLFNAFGSEGMDLAGDLVKRGYKIYWLAGGYDRWEWYMNNVEGFGCNELLD